jgi:4-hydroxy-tetrahydrodipicolinate synthase
MLKAFFAGKMDDAAKLHYRLMPLFKGLFMTANPIPVKAALNMIGVEVGGLRLPLIEANQEQKRQIRVLLEDLGIL